MYFPRESFFLYALLCCSCLFILLQDSDQDSDKDSDQDIGLDSRMPHSTTHSTGLWVPASTGPLQNTQVSPTLSCVCLSLLTSGSQPFHYDSHVDCIFLYCAAILFNESYSTLQLWIEAHSIYLLWLSCEALRSQ